MSNLKQTRPSGTERQIEEGDRHPPQDEDGYYICYRERADGEPCQRRINAPWVPCYDHFGEPPLNQSEVKDEDERE
jgi:hypothetical protein